LGLIVLVLIGALATATAVGLGRSGRSGVPVRQPGPPTPAPSGLASPAGAPTSAQASQAVGSRPSASSGVPNRPNCSPQPSACGFPDATNTGVPAGTGLAVINGNLSISQVDAVVEGKDIRGCVEVKAPHVTIRRSKVTCTDFIAITSFAESYRGGGLLVEDVEIDCKRTNGTGIGSYGFTARRLHIHGCENGFDIDNTATVVDSYIHDLYEGATGHADGIQLAGGAHIVISHNTIFNPGGTSAIISHPTANSDVLVTGNLLGGGAYTLYCPRDSSTAYRVLDNRFSTLFSAKGGEYGPWSDCDKAAEVRGNVWDATLKPVI
jgi:hypothetical protein